MIPETERKKIALLLAALLAASAFGYWGYSTYRKRDLKGTVVDLVKDTSLRLRDALNIETGPQSADRPEVVRKLDDHMLEVDKHLMELRGNSSSPNRALTDAADGYLLTARQILREQAASHRYRIEFSGSMQALLAHMRTANRRSAFWINEAIRAKDRVEKDYFSYKLAVETFDRLLESYPDARAKLALHVDAALLIEPALAREARKRELETSKQAASEMERARQLAAVR
jgi:hypothetical protein